jgi:hypothetical protein
MNTTFWKLDPFLPSGEGWETLALLSLLGIANLNHQTSQNPLESRDQNVLRHISFFYVVTQLFNACVPVVHSFLIQLEFIII